MAPLLNQGDRLFVNKLVYTRYPSYLSGYFDKNYHLFHAPERGDVIVFTPPHDYERDFVKRVIGIPGDVVDIDGAHVYVNGDMVNYSDSITRRVHENWPIIVPESEYFVLGDNRELSFDSRNWGSVDESLIIGKVWVIYWPFGKMKAF
jgi:signal peptidase I